MKKYSVKKAGWLTEIRADRDEWVELLGLTPDDAALRHVGISRETWAEIADGKSPRVPISACRLASFRRWGCLGELAGSAWSDFFVSGDTLGIPRAKKIAQRPGIAVDVVFLAGIGTTARRSG